MLRVNARISGGTGLPGLYTAYFDGETGTGTVAEATDALGRVRDLWVSIATSLAAGLTINFDTSVHTLAPAGGELLAVVNGTVGAPVTSGGTGSLPSATMGVMQLLTGLVVNGRILRGRSYIGPLATAANTGGVPTSAFQTALITAGSELFTGATGIDPVVWHRPTNGAGGTVGTVSGISAAPYFGVLRSRRD